MREAADEAVSVETSPASDHEAGRAPTKLALLMCDTPVPAVLASHGTYFDIFREQLRLSNSNVSFPFSLDGFDVVTAQEYPNLDKGEYKGVLISGSKFNAYDNDPWIVELVHWVADAAERHPEVKLIGICYGHQIIARTMGGKCLRNDGGKWEVGTTEFELSDVGKEVFQTQDKTLQMHRDIVPFVPPTFLSLGSSRTCQIQGLVRYYPSASAPSNSPRSAADIHILTVQGHPEFTSIIVNAIIDVREASGAMDADTVTEGRRRAPLNHDGIGSIGRAMWRVLGVPAPA